MHFDLNVRCISGIIWLNKERMVNVMGRTILCNACKSTFNEDVLANKENPNVCPVCGESLVGEEELDSTKCGNAELSFGEGIVLGENDSFDEDKIDFWWYELREPGTLNETDGGGTSITCTNCGHLSGTSYPIAKVDDFLLLDPRGYAKCSNCKNELKNHILSKRPADWVDPRKREMWVRDYTNTPKCPICGSVKIHKISLTNKVTSAIAFGILAAGHVSKTYKCDICGSKF